MNDAIITINNFGPISKSKIHLKKITIINKKDPEQILTKRILEPALASLAYGPYDFKREVVNAISGAREEMRTENYCLSQCLYILATVLYKRKEHLNYHFIERIYKKACKLLYFLDLNPKYFPECRRLFEIEISEMEENLTEGINLAFKNIFNRVFKRKKEFKKFLNKEQLEKFEKNTYNLYHIDKYEYFNNSTIEISGRLFDKKIDSRFEIKNNASQIEVNEEFFKFFDANEIISLEIEKPTFYEYGDNPDSIMKEVYHSSMLARTSFNGDMNIEELMDGEYYNFYKILGGMFVDKNHKTVFRSVEHDEDIFKNYPEGMNYIAKIQLLFENDSLRRNSVLILDDVEKYLTHKWQDKLFKCNFLSIKC